MTEGREPSPNIARIPKSTKLDLVYSSIRGHLFVDGR
jgi:hypothetical protein